MKKDSTTNSESIRKMQQTVGKLRSGCNASLNDIGPTVAQPVPCKASATVRPPPLKRRVPCSSCPGTMLGRIDVAKRYIEDDKERARQQACEYVPVFGPLGFTELAVAIFERLACNANMEQAWRTLAKVFDDTKLQPDTWAFADFCYQNIRYQEFSPRRSPAEHKRYFEQIADDVMSVATRVVCEPEFGMLGDNSRHGSTPGDGRG